MCTPGSAASPITSPMMPPTRCDLVRQIVGTLGPRNPRPWDVEPAEEPLYPPESVYEVVAAVAAAGIAAP